MKKIENKTYYSILKSLESYNTESSMSLYDEVLEAIKIEMEKCHSTAQAEKIGNQVTVKETRQDNKTIFEYSYPDGTKVTLTKEGKSRAGRITSITTSDGKELHELGEDSYALFQHQKDMLISKYGEDGYNTLCKMADLLETGDYHYYEWQEPTRDPLTGKLVAPVEKWMIEQNQQRENYDFVMENMDFYEQACKDNDLRSYGDFYTVKYVAATADYKELSKKRIITNKERSIETCGADFDMFTSHDIPSYVITIREHDNPANTGLFTGNMINEYRSENESKGSFNWRNDTRTKDKDMLKGIHTVTGQKYENLIINKGGYLKSNIIIRKPYVKSNI